MLLLVLVLLLLLKLHKLQCFVFRSIIFSFIIAYSVSGYMAGMATCKNE
jgi:hypothetical protein